MNDHRGDVPLETPAIMKWFARTVVLLAAVVCLPSANVIAADVVLFVGDTRYDIDKRAEIQLFDGNGKAHRRIVTKYPVSNAALNPSGTTVAYLRADQPELRSIGVDGRGDRAIARTQKRDRIGMAWSPNGRYIAYGHKTSFVLFSAVSAFDVRQKRVVAYYELPRNHTFGATTHAVIDVDWSPNGRYMTVLELVIIFTGISVRYEYHTTVIDTGVGRVYYFGNHKNYGFLSNKEYLVKTSTGDIGVVNIFNGKTRSLIDLGPVANISAMTRGPRGRRILVAMTDAKKSFDQGLTGLTRLRGVTRQEVLAFDFVQVDLRERSAKFVTPKQTSFLENLTEDRKFDWQARTPSRTFKTRSCWGWVITKLGTPRADRIIGTPFSDVIFGGAGNDFIDGRGGDDILCGGPGHDRLYGKAGDDVILGDIGLNRFDGNVSGFAGRDQLFGGDGADYLVGEAGDDVLRGGKGDDVVDGGSGNDRLSGQQGTDIARGGAGIDRCVEFEQTRDCE